ncbi:hypothetical protein CKO15_05640 [Halorhodospira abdelmalekii]|uniref:Stp1/IreP family PP2C-type Ser/Thr phosphatase n=1 Tax=Halorhodospira abdelmalekii TaxID=421629 RepID=UPI0019032C6C|nr:Stp1/IreP family PP2C-type Ser/Thr phosphatase [Halorhodospira abdelmalekii]MBK1734779.1 hypothetical protein [Halorhodospira abdelmalekii]
MSTAFAAATDTGRVRTHNEDAWIARPEQGLWVVADGMGGHSAGEVASALAVQEIAAGVARGHGLEQAIRRAHEAILEAVAVGQGAPGMGTTVVALALAGSRYHIAWVGDSRAYLWNGRSLRQLTTDHSYVQRLVDAGVIAASEAAYHPERHTVTQALGVAETIVVDSVTGTLTRGEQILLCSDGLSGEVEAEEIAQRLARGNVQRQVDALVAAALERGGADNVTVVLISAPPDAPVSSAESADSAASSGAVGQKTVPIDTRRLNRSLRRRQRLRRWVMFGAGVLISALLISLLWWFDLREPPAEAVAVQGIAQVVEGLQDNRCGQMGVRKRQYFTI